MWNIESEAEPKVTKLELAPQSPLSETSISIPFVTPHQAPYSPQSSSSSSTPPYRKKRFKTNKNKSDNDNYDNIFKELKKTNELLERELDERKKALNESMKVENKKLTLMEKYLEIQASFLSEIRKHNISSKSNNYNEN